MVIQFGKENIEDLRKFLLNDKTTFLGRPILARTRDYIVFMVEKYLEKDSLHHCFYGVLGKIIVRTEVWEDKKDSATLGFICTTHENIAIVPNTLQEIFSELVKKDIKYIYVMCPSNKFSNLSSLINPKHKINILETLAPFTLSKNPMYLKYISQDTQYEEQYIIQIGLQ